MTKGSHRRAARKASQGRAANNIKKLTAVRAQPSVSAEKVAFSRAVPSAQASPIGTAKQSILQYPHISGELKKIGIIAGTLLVVMAILSLVL